MAKSFGYPPSYRVERYESQVIEVLNLLGHPNAFVRDDTAFFELMEGREGCTDCEWRAFGEVLHSMYGLKADKEDFVWEIAAQMAERQ
jgi:hypothetical protein